MWTEERRILLVGGALALEVKGRKGRARRGRREGGACIVRIVCVVGGWIVDAVFRCLGIEGRFVACGL